MLREDTQRGGYIVYDEIARPLVHELHFFDVLYDVNK